MGGCGGGSRVVGVAGGVTQNCCFFSPELLSVLALNMD